MQVIHERKNNAEKCSCSFLFTIVNRLLQLSTEKKSDHDVNKKTRGQNTCTVKSTFADIFDVHFAFKQINLSKYEKKRENKSQKFKLT